MLITHQVSPANLSNSLTSQYPLDSGDHILKKPATEIAEQDFLVKWFKFSGPSSKPRMTATSTLTPVHVAYSPIVFMNHQWTASPKGLMASSFGWTSLFKSRTPSTLCLGDPSLARLNQFKLLCETEFCITKYIPLCDQLFILELHFCSQPRPYYTSQRCIFRANVLQPK